MASEGNQPPADPGTCRLCGETIYRSKATAHLKRCRRRFTEQLEGAAPPVPLLQIAIQARWNPVWWLQVEVLRDAPLYALDDFLREIWCECCGHLSGFDIGPDHYASDNDPGPGYGFGFVGLSMDVSAGDVLRKGTKFRYTYDYGSSTELELKVVDERSDVDLAPLIKLLARNDPPPIGCAKCGQPADFVCVECRYEPGGWLCENHARRHPCGEEMLLPVVNSPRVGECGYTGPADDPDEAQQVATAIAAVLSEEQRELLDAVGGLCHAFYALHGGSVDGAQCGPILLTLAADHERLASGRPRDLAAAAVVVVERHLSLLAEADDGPIEPADVPGLFRADPAAVERHADWFEEMMAMLGLTQAIDGSPNLRLVD